MGNAGASPQCRLAPVFGQYRNERADKCRQARRVSAPEYVLASRHHSRLIVAFQPLQCGANDVASNQSTLRETNVRRVAKMIADKDA